ncbi:Scavenger receptor cysteine-rich domain superfamily protein [Geodia barretti]|uniref:Scavenger receptor cysteine-rich domain superfamily protein n=1 Tax=Geodia barretti TaxID=519541 RepID=A0AA35W4Z2_GEOBA|nr:Scavenger receptor cysteine-rich domain superfamily protein [Geodia barretti]
MQCLVLGHQHSLFSSSNVECSGNESNITECSHSDVNSVGVCLHADDVGVICEGPPGSCRDGDIRVQGGTVGTVDSVSGNIEVCYTGLWGTVCAATGDWTNENAQVACRQLGYAEVETTEVRPLQSGDFHLQSLLSGVNCSGSEKRLADCHHDGVDLADTTGCARAFVRCLKANSYSSHSRKFIKYCSQHSSHHRWQCWSYCFSVTDISDCSCHWYTYCPQRTSCQEEDELQSGECKTESFRLSHSTVVHHTLTQDVKVTLLHSVGAQG